MPTAEQEIRTFYARARISGKNLELCGTDGRILSRLGFRRIHGDAEAEV